MTRKIQTIDSGVSHIEECLLNLKSLVRFGLYQIEHSGPEEFGALHQEWCTMMYMIRDQIEAAHDYNGEIEVMERQRSHSEARH